MGGVITDLCLRVQCRTVQATGKAVGAMVLQEQARWLTLLVQEALGLGCSSTGTAHASCPGQEDKESHLTMPLSTGDAVGSYPFSSSTCSAFEHAP